MFYFNMDVCQRSCKKVVHNVLQKLIHHRPHFNVPFFMLTWVRKSLLRQIFYGQTPFLLLKPHILSKQSNVSPQPDMFPQNTGHESHDTVCMADNQFTTIKLFQDRETQIHTHKMDLFQSPSTESTHMILAGHDCSRSHLPMVPHSGIVPRSMRLANYTTTSALITEEDNERENSLFKCCCSRKQHIRISNYQQIGST